MGNLIIKDVLIQKKYFLAFILFSIIMSLSYSRMDTSYTNIIFIIIPVIIVGSFVTNASIKDDKAENMINSLPVNRIDIILAKYLSIFVFIFIAVAMIFVSSFGMNFMGIIHLKRLMNFRDVGICAGLIIFISSLYFPINFKLGYSKSRYIVMVLYMGVFFITAFIGNKNSNKVEVVYRFISHFNTAPTWQIIFFIICLLAIIMLLSFCISCYLYKNKDLN